MDTIEITQPIPVAATFTVAHQKVDIDVTFDQQVHGTTEITIYPDSQDLKEIRLHGRQCDIKKVLVNNHPPSSVRHEDPCDQLTLHADAGVHQHHLLSEKIANAVADEPEPNIIITLPKKIRIVPVQVADIHTQSAELIRVPEAAIGGAAASDATQALSDTTIARFTPLTLFIEFESCHIRESVQFVSGKPGSGRWPHAYTRTSLGPGGASCLFPCVDRLRSRCTWEFSIKCPRTVGDAISQALPYGYSRLNGDDKPKDAARQSYEGKEMNVICSGELTDEIVDKTDSSKKTMSFSCLQQLAPEQIGFAIGPFERINLGEFRDAQEVEELGRNAVEMLAYCLPGRAEDTKNTCLPTTRAMDFVVHKYISCPVQSYSMCFVEDLPTDTSIFAGLTMCSARLLYPEAVIDPAQEVTRHLAHAIVSQWIGINIVADEPRDNWVIIGASYYIAGLFMKDLCGNNEYRYHIKQQADLVVELDHERPSMYEMGALLHVDPSEYRFLAYKAPVVLFILDRRFAKVHGASKMPGILAKILTRSRTGDLANNALSTDFFQKTCERFHHNPIEDFMTQWVKGAGCPKFVAFQRFNKKKLVVEMLIQQRQGEAVATELNVGSFMRDAREDFHTIYAAAAQPVFTGPMTIRIHEADGTPYEHTVEIKEVSTTIDIPYNTKYKRLKRSKKQRARAANKAVAEAPEEETDSLVYCLGDVLQGEHDIENWKISEWSNADESAMNSESYEWIRLDADFEWICRIDLKMPGYMYTSQLQQDRDVVAQLEAVTQLSTYPPSGLISSIFLRTLMDRRYFHGVRSLAARGLVKHADGKKVMDDRRYADNERDMEMAEDTENDRDAKRKKEEKEGAKNVGLFHLRKAFDEFYCTHDHKGKSITRPNDFSDQQGYLLRCEIIEAMANVRDLEGYAPIDVLEFLLDKLKFNDNSVNDYSDAHYIARLMKALTSAVVARQQHHDLGDGDMDFNMENGLEHLNKMNDQLAKLEKMRSFEHDFAEEIDRYRRMDEWTSSYQNLYSRTALECQSIIAAAGIRKFSPLHFLQYTRPGNYDMLRQTAYTVLATPSIFDQSSILRYVVYCMVADSSPWIRQSLHRAFGKVLAKRAIGMKTNTVAESHGDALVIEDIGAAADDRQKELARRSTIEGAIAALKKELGDHQALKAALWNAISFDQIILEDLRTLLDFTRLLYEPVNEMKVSLHLPRYWKVENRGQGKLKFTQTRKVRSKPSTKWQPTAQVSTSTPLKLQPPPLPTSGQSQYNVLPPPLPRPIIPSTGGGVKLKLKLGGGNSSGASSQISAQTPTPPPPPQLPRTASAEPGRVVLKFKGASNPKH